MFFAFSPFRSWSRLGPSWTLLGPLGGLLGASWRPLGGLLGPLGALLGRSWGALGSLRGALGAILEEIYQRRGGCLLAPPLQSASSRLLGPPERPKSFQNLGKINVLCFLAFSLLELSWAILDVPTTRETPRPGQWGGVRGGVNPSPKGKKGVGRGNSLDHLRPKGLVGLILLDLRWSKARASFGR